jgi:hypothetical protein
MMRKAGHLVIALAVSALVAAGGVATGLAAGAKVEATCDGSSSASSWSECQIETQGLGTVSSVTLVVTLESGDGQNNQVTSVSWQGVCYQNGSNNSAEITSPTNPTKMPISTGASVIVDVPLPYTDPRGCTVSATSYLWASLGGGSYDLATPASWQMQMEYLPWPSATATPSPSPSSSVNVPLISGYGGKCLDDKANRMANRTEVVIWTCNSADPSQGWKFTNGELVHNGKCANDQANGGGGTKVILWTCNRARDESWSHTSSDGEFVLGSRSHGLLCLTDPGHSTTNRTQLIVYACHNTSNQHWT